MLLTPSWLLYVILLPFVLVGIAYKYSTRRFDYWTKRRVPGPTPLPFCGNILEVLTFRVSIGDYFRNVCGIFNEPYVGIYIFDEPCLLIKSPEIVKNVLSTDFNYFKDRTIASPQHDRIVSNTLFVQKSPRWKEDRAKLTRLFTTAKMKAIFPLLRNIGNNLVRFLYEHPGRHDAKDICNNYSIDIIAYCFFGLNAGTIEKYGNGVFGKTGKAMFDNSLRNAINQSIYFFKTNLVNLLRLRFFDPEVQSFFINTFLNAVRERETMNFQRGDFISTLLEINKEDPSFDYDRMASQGLQFFAAGFETSASTIAYTLYEMAVNPDIQQRLREEILESLDTRQEVTYESIREMRYLNTCIMETLRKYPPLPFLDRRCDNDYKIPGTDLIIEKGMAIYISLYALQNDENHFPEPQKYNPDRFEGNVNKDLLIHFPFGYGPRTCIGEIFGLLSVKLALVRLLINFEVEKLPETPVPIRFDPKAFTLQSTCGLPLKFTEIVRTLPVI